MRKWFEYSLDEKKKVFENQFTYSNYLLKKNSQDIIKKFKINKLKRNELYFSQYNYFKKKIKNESLFLCSGYGLYEFFLKKKYKNFVISDSQKIYKRFNKKNKLSNYKIINVLNYKDFRKIKFVPKNIILNNVEYLFNDKKFMKCLHNIYKFSSKKTYIYIVFRSRYYTFLYFYDNFIIPFEMIIKKILFTFVFKKKIINLNLHGFRRSKKEFEILLKKYFTIKKIYEDLFTTDYNRSSIINKFNLGNILKFIFNHSHPYLHIYKLKKR